MSYEAINFRKKFALFDEQWQPKVIAEMNDYQFKVVKLQGDFIWHDHKNTDETFIVLEGNLRIDFRDGSVHLSAGEMFVVPKGVEHKPYAEREVKLLLIEPRGVLKAASLQPGTMFGFDPIPESAFDTKRTCGDSLRCLLSGAKRTSRGHADHIRPGKHSVSFGRNVV
jgi:mannose-6-phosphate isomerase-like protein (cupin superfamily)